MTDWIMILRRIKEGDEKSFRLLYENHVSDLYRFAYRYVKSASISEEIVQNTFVTLWSRRSQIDETKNIKSYIFTIAYHQIIREFRRQVKNPLLRDFMEYASSFVEPEKACPDYDTYIKALEKAKKKLSPRQREIFEMNKELELSVKEISERLGIEEQVVRNQLSKAMKTIREQIARNL